MKTHKFLDIGLIIVIKNLKKAMEIYCLVWFSQNPLVQCAQLNLVIIKELDDQA